MHSRPSSSADDAPANRPSGSAWLHALWIAIPLTYFLVLGIFFDRVGGEDHDQHLVFHEMQYWNAHLFGWTKQWSPVMCGGLSLAADPQVPFLSLGMVLGYLIGPFYGLRIATWIYLVFGWLGGYLYSGLVTRDRTERALAASLFIGNGFFACRLCKGHITFLPFLVLPLLLWLVHRVTAEMAGRSDLLRRAALLVLSMLAAGAGLAVMLDGSPQTIIYCLPWMLVYATVYAFVARSPVPIVFCGGALAVSALLGAGYLLPMLSAQQEFPRQLAGWFTNPLILPFYMLLPGRGVIIPARGGGHEYSVFIGPIIAFLIWRYRRALAAALPRSVSWPWLVTSVFAFIFGVGSLASFGIPRWLSPFDLARTLPGFRSVGITGRYWGFLVLPLAVLGALALARFVRDSRSRRRLAWWMSAVLVLQLGYQIESVSKYLIDSGPYEPVPLEGVFQGEPESIEYVMRDGAPQSEIVRPTRGVVDCYNFAEFIRPPIRPGTELIRSATVGDEELDHRAVFSAEFLSWTTIRLHREGRGRAASGDEPVVLSLNQAFNRRWRSSSGRVFAGEEGHLCVSAPAAAFEDGGLRLTFHDPASALGWRIASTAWICWLAAFAVALLAAALARRRRRSKIEEASQALPHGGR